MSRILDSIANISISQACSEVFAVAVQETKTDTKLIVASNSIVPASTITHLTNVWKTLNHLSKDYKDYNDVPDDSASPKRPATKDLTNPAQMRVWSLRRMILQFGYQKWRKRALKNYTKFTTVDREDAKELALEPIIQALERMKPLLVLDDIPDDCWDTIWAVLEHIRLLFDPISDNIKRHENKLRTPFPLLRYLSKIVSVIKDIKILTKAANSPRMRYLFSRDFQVIALKGSGDIKFNLPKSQAGWTQLVQNTLRCRNETAKAKGEVSFQLNQNTVQQHIAQMCKTPLRSTNYVHCELNIVNHILQSSEPGFLNYIGVSKLCCRGCSQCIEAVNHVLGSRFKTKGTHQKFYYPWRFPTLPEANFVAARMRNTMCFLFGQMYEGFCPKTQPCLSDSEAAVLSSTDDGSDSEGGTLFEAIARMELALENAGEGNKKKKKRKSQGYESSK